MKGFPRWINTREDVDNLLSSHPEEMRATLQQWLDGRWVWVVTGKLAPDEPGLSDAIHRVIEESDTEGGAKRLQQELAEDPHCHIFRVGLTVEEAERILSGGEL